MVFFISTGNALTSNSTGDIISGFAACNSCHKVYKVGKNLGTTSLINHINNCHKKPVSSNQPTITRSFGSVITQESKNAIIDAAVNFVCCDMRPFFSLVGDGKH